MNRVRGAVVVASFATFLSSLLVLLIFDDRNDHDLLRAQCEANAASAQVVREVLVYLLEEYPGVSEVEVNVRAYLAACLPEHDCECQLTAPSVPEVCTASGRQPGG